MKKLVSSLFALLGATGIAHAQLISWTDWTSATIATTGSATGTMGYVQGLTSITVTYSGQLHSATQTSGGTNYWVPSTPYTGASVSNAPGINDILTVGTGSATTTQTITFSSPVTNPVMAIVSLGQTSVGTQWSFNAPFSILSQGAGYWGGTSTSLTKPSGNILQGNEGHGTIRFTGTFSSISWTSTTPEDWAGFTIGATATIPEPGTVTLLALGATGLIAARRRHR